MSGKTGSKRPKASVVHKKADVSGMRVDPLMATNSSAYYDKIAGTDNKEKREECRESTGATAEVVVRAMFEGKSKKEMLLEKEKRRQDEELQRQRRLEEKRRKDDEVARIRAEEAKAPPATGAFHGLVDVDDEAAKASEDDVPDEWDA
eukprot:Rhum_TRINITY_DN44_c0_g1::Rhum_TRINITY_DN44_c0_g1_i1::g.101::m.101